MRVEADQINDRARSGVVLLFFVMIALVGMAVVHFFVTNYAVARASHNWASVEGIVLSGARRWDQTSRYSYSIDGAVFQSSRRRVVDSPLNLSLSHHGVPGDAVNVFVDPADPSYSVLKPGGSVIFYAFGITIGIALTFLGFAGLARSSLGAFYQAGEMNALS